MQIIIITVNKGNDIFKSNALNNYKCALKYL